MGNEIRRNMSLFPMSIVMKLTDLTARQIRYYEQHQLITPERSEGKQRIFSLNDIDRLLEIKDLIEQGVNLAGIKAIYQLKSDQEAQAVEEVIAKEEVSAVNRDLTDKELRDLLKAELFSGQTRDRISLIQGELSRFFH
ncbi:MerR family transcriptional regulator [Bacillus horti]|uniref:MerR family glutamine synthetase transcriptional repressor n=1 Tax=Caldalkalibacillus horti TaxID=77523 RepID=A0ABT9VV22_9BACI|nr:MerR family transcriptional regulator [Bacillus horti]MDQ0164843.1 MerR family glutamine synthetase transcriptional repressor [Bacillus horti]